MRMIRIALVAMIVTCGPACGGPPPIGDDAGLGVEDSGLDGSSPDATGLPDATGMSDTPASTRDTLASDGHTADAPGPDAGPVAALSEVTDILCGGLAEIGCSAPWDCACPGFGERPDFLSCVADEREICSFGFITNPLAAGIAARRIRTDLELLRECVADLRTSYARCSGSRLDLGALCTAAFVDAAALGEECSDALCAEGAGVCSYETGTCVPLPTEGLPCELACSPGLRCVAGTCAPPAAAGEPCESDASCAGDLACSAGTCRALASAGSRCDESADCAVSLECAGAVCTDTPTASCTESSECSGLEACGAGAFEGTCRVLTALGEPCDADDACADARCDFTTGLCAPRLGEGESCAAPTDCASGLLCALTGLCTRAGRLGEDCVASFEGAGCAEGLTCRGAVCVTLPGDGEACGDAGECAPGLACVDDGATVKCGAPRSIGESCFSGTECGDLGRCDFLESRCAPRLAAGADCFVDADCEVGLLCVSDPLTFMARCRSPLPIGERCDAAACVEGAFCRFETGPASCEPTVCSQVYFF